MITLQCPPQSMFSTNMGVLFFKFDSTKSLNSCTVANVVPSLVVVKLDVTFQPICLKNLTIPFVSVTISGFVAIILAILSSSQFVLSKCARTVKAAAGPQVISVDCWYVLYSDRR